MIRVFVILKSVLLVRKDMKLLLLYLNAMLGLSSASNILAFVPVPARSHANLFDALVVELANRGHQVTYVTTFEIKSHENITQLIIPDSYDKMMKNMGARTMFDWRKLPLVAMRLVMPFMATKTAENLIETEEMQSIIKSDAHFDLILSEAMLTESIQAGMSHKFKAPMVALSPVMATHWANFMVGNNNPSSYVPDPLSGLHNRMNFFERLSNTFWDLVAEILNIYVALPNQDALMRKHFGDNLPYIADIIKNTSLVLINHHHSLAFPRPYVTNMVEIGGFHVKVPKELPEDLKKYFEGSKEGVILFSLGSHVKSAQMPPEKKQLLLEAFSKLKQNVLWKFEDDSLENIPKNVRISKWLPQSDILAHPNLKLFITHGGLLSTTEAVTRGMPVVGIPIMGDQPINMKQVEKAGFGISLEYDDLTVDSLVTTINEVINNPKYRETAQLRSQLLTDRPLSPMYTAMYWIEYVIRHKGAPHLRSAAQDLTWCQLYLVDVFLVLALGFGVGAFLTYYLTRLFCRKIMSLLCGKRESEKISKKKTK